MSLRVENLTPNNGVTNTIKILLETTGMSLPMENHAITTKDPITSGSPPPLCISC